MLTGCDRTQNIQATTKIKCITIYDMSYFCNFALRAGWKTVTSHTD